MRRLLPYAGALCVLLYFVPLASHGLTARWAPDDMMNLHIYWRDGGLPRALAEVPRIWGSFYRPMGGVFYMTLWPWVHLDPLPYRAVAFGLLAANALLAFAVARRLSRSVLVASLAAMITGFHSGQLDLHFNTSSIYDVLAFFFTLSALLAYMRLRGRARAVVVPVLYLFAIQSKEIAVTLPVLLLAYELAYRGWRPREYRAIAVMAAIGAIYSIGRMQGLAHQPGYKPVFTIGRYLDNNAIYAGHMLAWGSWNKVTLLALWAALAYAALRRRRPHLRFAWCWIVFGTLPVAFIWPRAQGALYLPVFGYSLFAAALFDSMARALSREPLFRWMRAPRSVCRAGAFVAVAGLLFHANAERLGELEPAYRATQVRTWKTIEQIRTVRPMLRPGTRVAFLNDPFPADYDTLFIAQLVANTQDVSIELQRGRQLPEAELAAFDHVFRFDSDGNIAVAR